MNDITCYERMQALICSVSGYRPECIQLDYTPMIYNAYTRTSALLGWKSPPIVFVLGIEDGMNATAMGAASRTAIIERIRLMITKSCDAIKGELVIADYSFSKMMMFSLSLRFQA